MKKTIGGKLLTCFVLTAVVSLLAVAGAMAADTATFNTASSGIVYRGSNSSDVAYCLNYTMGRPDNTSNTKSGSLSSDERFYDYLGLLDQNPPRSIQS